MLSNKIKIKINKQVSNSVYKLSTTRCKKFYFRKTKRGLIIPYAEFIKDFIYTEDIYLCFHSKRCTKYMSLGS